MIQLVEDGKTVYRCAMCGTTYRAITAARACEDAHLDEKRADRAARRERMRRG